MNAPTCSKILASEEKATTPHKATLAVRGQNAQVSPNTQEAPLCVTPARKLNAVTHILATMDQQQQIRA